MTTLEILEVTLLSLFGLMMIWSLGVVPFLRKKAQKRQDENLERTINALKPGDKILLSAGIRGLFIKAKGEVIHVQVAENTVLKVDRHAIMGVYK